MNYSEKDKYCTVSPIGGVKMNQLYRNRERSGGYPELKGGRNAEVLVKVYKV